VSSLKVPLGGREELFVTTRSRGERRGTGAGSKEGKSRHEEVRLTYHLKDHFLLQELFLRAAKGGGNNPHRSTAKKKWGVLVICWGEGDLWKTADAPRRLEEKGVGKSGPDGEISRGASESQRAGKEEKEKRIHAESKVL